MRRTKGTLRDKRRKNADIWELTIPAATAVRSARTGVYEVTATGPDGKEHVFAMAFEGYRFPLTDPRASAPAVFRVACSRVPAENVTFSVRAISCWGKKSAALTVKA